MAKTKSQIAFEAARDAALASLVEAGALAFTGKKAIDEARAKTASALDTGIAAFMGDGVFHFPITHEVRDSGGNIVKCEPVTIAQWVAMGRTFKNADGTEARGEQSAWRVAVLQTLFKLKDDKSGPCNSVWTMATNAVDVAAALIAQGMTAKLVDSKLVIEGGEGEKAEALRAAANKSASALVKAAKGKTGNGRDGSGTGDKSEGKAEPQAREATPSEIVAAAAAIARKVAKGEEALCNAALSTLRQIAALVAKHPDAFADI